MSRLLTTAVFLLLLAGCSTTHVISSMGIENTASVLTPIHEEALVLVRKYQTTPLRTARLFAYLDTAILQTNRSIAGTDINSETCDRMAYTLAGYALLEYYFPLEMPGRLVSKPRLMADWDNAVCDTAKQIAGKIIQATIAKALRDGSMPPKKVRPQPSHAIGLWAPTAPLFSANPGEPYAGEWKTLVIGNPSELNFSPPPLVNSMAYQKSVDEVLRVAASLTPAQKDIAEKWNLDAGSVTPAGVWNMRLHKIVAEAQLSDQQAIRLFSAMHTAMYDALIACSYAKYLYWTERPITATQRQGKSEFKPLLVTPSFPAYPSGHACASGAAARVIGVYLPKRKDEVMALANEAAESRIYGGIHFRFDVEEGLQLGAQVGDKVIRHFADTR